MSKWNWAGQMAQWSKVSGVLAENPGWLPTTYIPAPDLTTSGLLKHMWVQVYIKSNRYTCIYMCIYIYYS